MIVKPLDQVTREDIESLVENEVRESKTLEYKQQLPGATREEKREFLYDVTSFANASGGDIVYGVEEVRDASGKSAGVPKEAAGLRNLNVDQEALRLENLIRDGVEPRPVVQIRWIDGFRDGPVLVLRVPQSWAAPHMVKFGTRDRFYSRTSAGKYPLDVGEIRAAFVLSESLEQRIRDFRADRLARIVAGETPVVLPDNPKIVLHVVPVSAYLQGEHIDLRVAAQMELQPPYAFGWQSRFNFDGVMWTALRGDVFRSYVQVFRNRAIEAVEATMIAQEDSWRRFAYSAIQNEVLDRLAEYLRAMKEDLEVSPPILVMLTLLGVRGFEIRLKRRFSDPHEHTFDRDDLVLPEVLLQDYDESVEKVLQPIFDTIWQAAGYPRCLSYDEAGNYVARKR